MKYDVPGTAVSISRFAVGRISRQQLLDTGLTPQMISTRLERGRWQQLYWGVYAVFTGPPPRET